MQYQAKKSVTFKDSLIAFAADNGAGCETGMNRINSTRGQAKKDGVSEAYDLIYQSDLLTREVGIPTAPAQCSENARRTPRAPETETIPYSFSTN